MGIEAKLQGTEELDRGTARTKLGGNKSCDWRGFGGGEDIKIWLCL